MARLVAQAGSLEGQIFPIDPGVTIGREAHNDIAMPQNRGASREHCKVWREGPHRFSVADFGSTNGTLVNDEKVVRQELKDGDVIRIGQDAFRFELEDEDKPKAKPKADERPDLASVLKGEAPIAKPPTGQGAAAGATIHVKERILQYQKKGRGGSVLGESVGQMAGLRKWILYVVVIGITVGAFLLAQKLTMKARTVPEDLPPAEVPEDTE